MSSNLEFREKPTLDEVLDWLPDAAREAVEAGTDWEIHDLDATMGYHDLSYCDDCECYHDFYVVPSYSVQTGVLYEDIWTCDADGDWDCGESSPVADPNWQPFEFDFTAYQHRELGYFTEVAETGIDYLGLLSVGLPNREWRTEEWHIRIRRSILGAILDAAKPARTYRWIRPVELPQHVRDFLLLEGGHGPGGQFELIGHGAEPKMSLQDVLEAENFHQTQARRTFTYGIVFVEWQHTEPVSDEQVKQAAREQVGRLERLIAQGKVVS